MWVEVIKNGRHESATIFCAKIGIGGGNMPSKYTVRSKE